MKKIIYTATAFLLGLGLQAQIKVWSSPSGYVAIGNTSTTPSSNLDVVAGDMNIHNLTNGYRINGNMVLWQNNQSSCLFVGNGAGAANTTGVTNTGMGYEALNKTTTGSSNTGIGYEALLNNTSGAYNTVLGYEAGNANSTGNSNTYIGFNAGLANTTGYGSTAIGCTAGASTSNGNWNTFVGYGADAGSSSYTNSSAFGTGAIASGSNYVAIGNTSVMTIKGQVNFGTYSDGRFKTNIKENVKGLEFIKKLRPVTYNVNTKALDDFLIQNMSDEAKKLHKASMDFTASSAMIHSGFIAQEVEQAAKKAGYDNSIVNLPANDKDLYSLSYAELVVPLVKAVQELSGTVDSLKQVIANAQVGNGNKTLDASIQGVSNVISGSSALLYQNNPNPFSQTTTVKCFIPKNSQSASLLVFDMNGSLKKTISIGSKGEVNTIINGRELVSGMYYYTLLIDGQEIDTKKMILTE